MEDPLISCIDPHSMCMRPSLCDYCSQPVKHNVMIEYLFGILACDEHKSWALRDCKAYMHKQGIVRVRDAKDIAGLSEFLTMLHEKDGTIPVKRTSGVIDTDWSVLFDWYEYPTIARINGNWSIRLRNTLFRKHVEISGFLREDCLAVFPAGFSDVVKKALECLDKGVYAEEHAWQKRCSAEVVEVNEHPLVGKAVMPNGTVVRVFSP
jgi:hypothetical protein